MTDACCCIQAFDLFSYWTTPARLVHRNLGKFYEQNPTGARFAAVPIALVLGVINVVLFPIACLAGVVAMPIIALVTACQNKKGACEWLKAWCFCILGVALSAAIMGVTSFHLSLVASSALMVGIVSVSIIFHVYHLVKEPVKAPILASSAA